MSFYRWTTEGYLLDTSVGDRGLAPLRSFIASRLELEARFHAAPRAIVPSRLAH